MKSNFLTLFILTLILSLTGCKNEASPTVIVDYKYADKDQVINCEGINNQLLNEALYSFENDISKAYNTKNSLGRAYALFFRNAMTNRARYTEIVSEHTKEVFEALKNEKGLWLEQNPKSRLNYNNEIIDCIGENMKVKDLKTTFNALLSTNSMSPMLYGEPVRASIAQATQDKHLALYIALDFYYANLFNIDFTKINFEEPQSKVDFNKLPPKEPQIDPSTGIKN